MPLRARARGSSATARHEAQGRGAVAEWRPRYVCIERWSDAPVVGLAYLQVEQLLTPREPWAQGRDLAAA